MTVVPPTPSGDDVLKVAQAKNFDDLNDVLRDTPYDRHLRFFNFGYRVLGDQPTVGPKLGRAFPNQDSAQLLFQLLDGHDLADRDVVEIGCGRGGNLWLVSTYFKPRTVTGVDIAPRSIEFCRQVVSGPNARFEVGDAEDVPLEDAAADVVLSVETSCTYPDVEAFFREVWRLLRPGGVFLYTDFLKADLVEPYIEGLGALGFELLDRRDISEHVKASRAERAARQRLAYGDRPSGDESTMGEFVGDSGSQLGEALVDGTAVYPMMRFRKPAGAGEPPAGRVLTPEVQAAVREQAAWTVEVLSIPSTSGEPEPG
ncbi:class I SAM-dependent methyltransferase [Aquihabitans daechungensis]|uniref:class I SAM-dependent methyltransferase n=1 Tax=Aquihabitans daechungensis TaxID=1052257 RepID=UPI003BA3B102